MSNTLVVYGTRPEYLKIKPLLRDNPSLHTLYIKQHEMEHLFSYPYPLPTFSNSNILWSKMLNFRITSGCFIQEGIFYIC